MDSRKTFTAIFLFTLMSAFSQPTWHETNIPFSARFDDIFFLNKNLGWAADGPEHKVYKTIDGGENWVLQVDIPDLYFRNIEFIDENVGFLGTLSDQFYKTTNGGVSWQEITNVPGPFQAICGLDAVGSNTIYGCGAYFAPAYVIKSTDRGVTWQFINMSQYAESLVEIMFIDENVGFVSGGHAEHGGVILKTIDGGVSWTEIYSTGDLGDTVWKMQRLFSNPNVLFASVETADQNNGKLLKSVDNGVNWVSKPVPDPLVQAVGFITENHGWMGGHNSGFLETFDAGDTWIDTQFGHTLNRMQIFDENFAYCSGQYVYKFYDESLGTPHFNTTPNSQKESYSVAITPNPLVNSILSFTVDFRTSNHLVTRLTDGNGKLLKVLQRETITAPGKKSYSFPFPYASGIYYLNLHDDRGASSEKIIKK